MREIKFRGKRIDNGEWVHGWYVGYSESQGYIYGDYVDKNEVWVVDAKTVGQCTGLKDKDGVDIYEGDILKTGGGIILKPVEIHNGSFMAAGYNGYYFDFFEVVGNIHDNPELLEGGQE